MTDNDQPFLPGDTLHNADKSVRRVVTHISGECVHYSYDAPNSTLHNWHCYTSSAMAVIARGEWVHRRIPSCVRLPDGI